MSSLPIVRFFPYLENEPATILGLLCLHSRQCIWWANFSLGRTRRWKICPSRTAHCSNQLTFDHLSTAKEREISWYWAHLHPQPALPPKPMELRLGYPLFSWTSPLCLDSEPRLSPYSKRSQQQDSCSCEDNLWRDQIHAKPCTKCRFFALFR